VFVTAGGQGGGANNWISPTTSRTPSNGVFATGGGGGGGGAGSGGSGVVILKWT
jgi:hypothetical protein